MRPLLRRASVMWQSGRQQTTPAKSRAAQQVHQLGNCTSLIPVVSPSDADAIVCSGCVKDVTVPARFCGMAKRAAEQLCSMPAGVLSLEHAAVSVGVRSVDSDSGTSGIFVAAVSEAGEAYVWRCSPAAGDDRRVSSQLLARISVGASRCVSEGEKYCMAPSAAKLLHS